MMDISIFIPLLVSWITRTFPSLGEYAEFVGPAVMVLVTAIGIFTSILPEPNHKYPLPDVADLELQLQGGGGFILKIAKQTRSLMVGINWFLSTAIYSWFYNATNAIARFLPKIRKTSTSTTK